MNNQEILQKIVAYIEAIMVDKSILCFTERHIKGRYSAGNINKGTGKII